MKLINRYNRYLFPALIILFCISAVSSYFLIKKVLQEELDEVLLRTRERVENYITVNKALPIVNSFDDQIIVFEKTATLSPDSGLSSTTQIIPGQNKSHLSRKLIFTVEVDKQKYKTTIFSPLEGTKHLTRLILRISIATIFLLLLLLLLINRQVLAKIWQPFYASLNTIKSFKVNKQVLPSFAISSIEEFNLMNDHFSIATENAIKDFKVLKEFSENASHEIQTPLAVIHSKLDLLAQQDNLTEKQSELLQSLYLSVSKLSRIQQSLLLLTKIDNQQFHKSSTILLHNEIKNKIEQFDDIWQNKRINYSSDINECNINCNKELLEILLNNFFSNATRHNIVNGSIEIILKNKIFEIRNTGENKPLDEDCIFRRFYKSTPNSESNGLGLSIIKEICEASTFNVAYTFNNNQHRFILTW